jgi:hypothetical protein
MLVCSCTVDCFVMLSMCDLALCNECVFSESQDEIPLRGVVCHTSKILVLGCD